MRMVALTDRKWAIGKGGDLLVRIPKDHQLFLQETLGCHVVMGRKTFESLPGKQPLYGRVNVVLSKDPSFSPKGVMICRSMEEALERLADVPRDRICVIGGESIYRLFLPYCSTADITAVDYVYDGDRFLPDLDRDPEWKLAAESEEETYFDLAFTFRRYKRIAGGKKHMQQIS